MNCAKCGAENREGRKFCAKCAAPLARVCPQCGASNEPGENFCGECAAALGQPPAASSKKSNDPPIRVADSPAAENLEGERKTVTALFADIKGSTELEQDLDPEEARAIVDPALKLMIDAVRRYDGYVVQSTGDGIFALFGAPVAHEDHPQRALYAALRMQDELKRYSARLREAGNLPLEARVGVNTGEVVVRPITTGEGHTEYTPIGHTTNLASRLQALAPGGSIAINEQTREFVEGYFELKPMGPTKVKGVTEPVNVYEVTGLGPLRTRLQRSAGRGLTRFVGRQHEIEAIKRAAARARAGRGQIVGLVAEPGVGKSRLLHEFKTSLEPGWKMLEAFSVSHGKASAYLPVIELLRGYFGIESKDDARSRREKAAHRLAALDRSLEDALPYISGMLGANVGTDPLAQMDLRIRQKRSQEAINRILLRESVNQPVIVVVEDLHWIDEQTQALLNLLADSIATAKVLLLLSYRPEYHHQWGSKSYYTQLRLDSLEQSSAAEMLTMLLGDTSELGPLKRLIVERTEGNPFFIEEMIQSLFEQGVLTRNGAVRLAKSTNAVKVPATVQAVLASRIDGLLPDEKEVLQTLAVLGREFPLAMVRRTVACSEDDLDRMLAGLQMAEFIYQQPSFPERQYIFKHALTQEVAYGSLLIERRKLLHERAAAAMEELYADRLSDHVIQLAHHYRHSGNIAKAVEYLHRAGEQTLAHSPNQEAIDFLTEALELLMTMPDDPDRARRELPIQLAIAGAWRAWKAWHAPEAEWAYRRALELTRDSEDPRAKAPAAVGMAFVYVVAGRERTLSNSAPNSHN